MIFRSVCATLIVLLATTMPSAVASSLATLRFGTACAKCHEGECSGRLSFARRPEAAYDHIRQYAGPTDDELAQQLYDALEQMKADCSYGALPAPDLSQPLNADDLAPYLDAWSGAYFLPLSTLAPGSYKLTIDFTGGGRVRVEVIDGDFDPFIDQCITVEIRRLEVDITLTANQPHYLRLQPRGPVTVDQLRLTRQP